MSAKSFIRCNIKDIPVPKDMTHEQIIEMNTRINTVIAYEFGINTLNGWRQAVLSKKIIHYSCYDEDNKKNMCEPNLPLCDATLYKIQLAWKTVFNKSEGTGDEDKN